MNKNLLKNKKNKVIFALTAIIICTGAISIASKAQTEKRAANIKSKGIFDFDNGTVVMDASDLTYLADEIDLLENTYKTETVKALNQIGTYYKLDGTTTFNKDEGTLSSDNANVLPFNVIIDGIIDSQSVTTKTSADNILSGMQAWVNGAMLTGTMPNNGTINPLPLAAGESFPVPIGYHSGKGIVTTQSLASQTPGTAIAGNISKGVTAWVNGGLITGTGADNNSYYNQGYADGLAKKENASLVYNYHKHTGSPSDGTGCYTKPEYQYQKGTCHVYISGCQNTQNSDSDGFLLCQYTETHTGCGKGEQTYSYPLHRSNEHRGPSEYTHEYTISSSITGYSVNCGKTTETIESATIVFN